MAKIFEKIETSKSGKIDPGYQTNYSAKRTENMNYTHPENQLFLHTHEDGHDCEDSYRNELVKIGESTIEYRYDWGNYFITEDVNLYIDGKRIAEARRSYGAVDQEEKSASNKAEAKNFLMGLAKPFGLSSLEFVTACCSEFQISKECFQLFLR